MKNNIIVFAGLMMLALCSSCSTPRIIWTEGETDPQTKQANHSLVIVNPPKGNDWCVWFAANHIEAVRLEGSQAGIERFNGCMYRIVPDEVHSPDSLKVLYAGRPIPRECWAPEGFALQQGNKCVELETEYNYLPAEPIGDFSYTPRELGAFDMIPALKSVVPSEGSTLVKDLPAAVLVNSPKAGWYRITIDGECKVEASDEDGAYYAAVTLGNIKRNVGGDLLPNAVIEDWPDLPYRGLMLDVSRNFTDKDGVLKLIDVLAHYKVNVLHLHMGDDEGWRVEIEDIPELTSFGAHHELPKQTEDGSYVEQSYLIPSFSGRIFPDDPSNSGNGYFSHKEFVEILRYAWERRIRVLPEFDSPGHARAAIKAVEKYAARTGDDSYLMSEKEDTSEYVSVQYYTDNAINVALPGTYRFFEKVFDTMIAYYQEAGAPLTQIHVGGDEVPQGAWIGSPACQDLMAQNGWDDPDMLYSYFIERLAKIAQERNLQLAGWQEIATGVNQETFDNIKSALGTVNFWNTRVRKGLDQKPYEYANRGVKVVLSNMTNAYMDFAYTPDKKERGHSWGGFVDERRSFSLLPYNIYRSVRWDDYANMNDISTVSDGKTELLAPENIVGIQGQLWSETIRCFDHVTYYFFPKAVGLFERGWNASPVWEGTTVSDDPLFVNDFDRFYSIIVDREMPFYESLGIAYRHRDRP